MLGVYRRLGANLPFSDPSGYHGVRLEGWFWRFVTPGGDVVLCIAAVCRSAGGTWGMAALGTSAAATVRSGRAGDVSVFGDAADVKVGGLLAADDRRLRVRLDGASLDVAFAHRRPFGGRCFGGLGPAQVVPGLSQYWHPHLPHARVTHGTCTVDGRTLSLDGADAYAEKNWGAGGMPERWWWGQGHVGDDRTCVAFAGGPAGIGPVKVDATALVVGEDRWVAPLQPLSIDVSDTRWAFVARGPRTRVEVEGTVDPAHDPTLLLPVPRAEERRVLDGHSPQHLSGRLRVEVRRRGVVQLSGETATAGLELGRG